MWFSVVGVVWLLLASGRVRDATTRASVSGVAVHVIGRSTGTMTDSTGAFRLVVETGDRLRFSRPGYRAYEASADSAMDVRLVANAHALEGIAVTAIRGEGGTKILFLCSLCLYIQIEREIE